MARIAGVSIPDDKRIEIALTYIYGIGRFLSLEILKAAQIDSNRRVKDLSSKELDGLRKTIDEKKYNIEGDLRRQTMMNVKRLKEINSYRGSRHAKGLPVRGQNTKTNSRTKRGNVRKTIGGNKIKPQKT